MYKPKKSNRSIQILMLSLVVSLYLLVATAYNVVMANHEGTLNTGLAAFLVSVIITTSIVMITGTIIINKEDKKRKR